MAHIHSVFDSNEHFVIDPVTREIANSLAKKIVVMQFDHNSERFTFEIPKVDGHNMANCDRVEIHYINVDAADKTLKSTGVYEVNDIQPSPDDNSVAVFSWLLSRNCTKYAGTLSFLIHFACTTDGVEDYAWNTAIFQSITIGNGMNNGAEVVEPFPDILAQWQAQLFSASETAVLNVTTAEANALAAIEAAGEAKKQAVLDSIPDEYEALSALADQNHRNKAGAIVLDAEGESIVVMDASEYPLQGLKLFGKSTQDGEPTPDAPVDIVSVVNPCVNVYGKNRFPLFEKGKSITVNGMTFAIDEDGIITLNGTASAITWVEVIYAFKMGTNPQTKKIVALKETEYYVFSRIVKGGNVTGSVSNTIQTDNAEIVINQDVLQRVFQSGGVYRGWITVAKDTVCDNYSFGLQIEIGNVATAYEPYKEQTLETSHTLPGIPVSSGGNYTDANGQQWICDEVDLARGVYVRRIFAKTITDFTKAASYAYDGAGTSCAVIIEESVTAHNGLCSHFVITHKATSVDRFNLIDKTIYFKLAGELTWEEWATRMTELSPTVIGVLTTPVETALTDAETTAFKALHSNRPNTTILNDAGAHMAVSYVADTKTYIDNKIAEMMKGVVE